RAHSPLLIMLHGWGYDETHLFKMATYLPDDIVVASMRAPTAEGDGFAWFPSAYGPIGDPLQEVANGATRAMLSWLDNLDVYSWIGLLGYSQGGAVALQLMRHAPSRFKFAVNLAGFVVNDFQEGDDVLAAIRPPVFWARGQSDAVIPEDVILRTSKWLSTHATADVRVYPHVDHEIVRQDVLLDVADFISAHR